MLLVVLEAVGVSLTGVLSPGPMTAVAIDAGSRRPLAGTWMALGHAVVEAPLMGLLLLGAGQVLQSDVARGWIGVAGGLVLVWMGLRGLRPERPWATEGCGGRTMSPFVTGICFTGGNPYFLVWWATAGLVVATRAGEHGLWAFGLFAGLHWLADLVWLQLLSGASYFGSSVFGARGRTVLQAVCGAGMTLFGIRFFYEALWRLL